LAGTTKASKKNVQVSPNVESKSPNLRYKSWRRTSICNISESALRFLPTAFDFAVAVVLVDLSATSARAATITVNTTSMRYTNDKACGLAEAIVAVNQKKAFDGCPAGNGKSDTIVVPAGTYSAISGVPLAIATSVTIQGAGNGVGVGSEGSKPVQTTIRGDALSHSDNGLFTVSDAASAVTVNFQGLNLEIASPGTVPVSGIYGMATQFAIAGLGTLTVSNSTIDQNISDSYGGGIDDEATSSASVISSSTISDNVCSAEASGATTGSGRGSLPE
jgi:hypothetical protein